MPLIIDDSATSRPVGPATARPPAPAGAQVPHTGMPFTFQRNGDGSVQLATVEQDTLDEVVACVQAIVQCPIGYRDELPPFGIHLPEFAQVPVDSILVQQQVARWEHRVDTVATEFADPSSEVWRHVRLEVSSSSQNELVPSAPGVTLPHVVEGIAVPFPSSDLFPGEEHP